jgi:hypothetical protein
MEADVQFYAATALPPSKEPPLPIEYVAGWFLEPVSTFWRKDKFLPCCGIETCIVQSVNPLL